MSEQPAISRFSSVTTKLRLLWVWKQGNATSKLSRNVLTEVCAFIAHQHLAIIDHRVFEYPSGERMLRNVYTLDNFVAAAYSAHVLVGDNQLVVCGGLHSHRSLSRAVLIDAGVVWALPGMRSARQSFGIYYLLRTNCVYVFGGVVTRSFPRDRDDQLKECEKFDLQRRVWTSLPDMISFRREFNVCECESKLYLCGGMTPYVEVFDPIAESFTRCPRFYLPEVSPTVTVVQNNLLIVLTYSFKTTWKGQHCKATFAQRKHWELSPEFQPVLVGDTVFAFDDRRTLISIDLTTDKYQEVV